MWYLLFVTNAINCFLKNKPVYGLSFLFLTCTSIVIWEFSEEHHDLKWWIDQIAIWTIIGFGLLNVTSWYPVIFVTCVGILHGYSLWTGDYTWYLWIHILSSVGHHLILQNF